MVMNVLGDVVLLLDNVEVDKCGIVYVIIRSTSCLSYK